MGSTVSSNRNENRERTALAYGPKDTWRTSLRPYGAGVGG